MNSVLDLSACAARHLDHYLDPAGLRAFRCYDRQGDPAALEPLDALAPGLLDAPVKGSTVIQLFGAGDTEYTRLRRAMQRLLDETNTDRPRFEDTALDDEHGPWQLVREVLQCCDQARGIAASKATKMLHRKRPALVPIFDAKVAAFYGATARKPWELWPRLQSDVRLASTLLDDISQAVRTEDGRRLTRLRAIDIVVWEHQVTECRNGVAP